MLTFLQAQIWRCGRDLIRVGSSAGRGTAGFDRLR